MYVIGLDGGGTKTVGVICDLNGRVLLKETVGPTNPNSLGYEAVEKEIEKLLTTLKENASHLYESVTSFFAGMSGVDREDDKLKMIEIFKKYLPSGCLIQVDNDAVNALYSGTLGKPGVVNISGTGAISFGINEEKIRTRVGGWGFMLDDPGSGFSIGKRGVKAIFEEFDGFGAKTTLTSSILSTLHLDKVPELIPVIYDFKKARETIASLSRVVVQAAEDGDMVSKEILHQAGLEMGMNIRRLVLKLYRDEMVKEVPIVLAGGIYNNAKWFESTIESCLKFQYLKPRIILPVLPPVAGSVIAAILHTGEKIDEDFICHFKEEITQ
jgi:N-acetylglucosamine kinase-like BadF-type ATPase